ncbi:MAG: ATP-binding protein [Planctomycetota bacterium]|nr:ATP-binding protein [Planctomycetota bacterium]
MRSILFRRIFVLYLLTIAVGTSVTYVVSLNSAQTRYKKEVENQLSVISALVEEITSEEIPEGLVALQEKIQNLAQKTNVRITIVDADGHVLADSEKNPAEMENHKNRPEIRSAFHSGTGISIRWSDTLQTEMMYFARKHKDGAGVVTRVALPLSGIKSRFWDVNRSVIAGFAVTTLLALIIGFFVLRHLTHSICEMKEVAQAIASGELSRRASTIASGEIGELGKALNEMSDALKEKIENLSRGKSQIETIISSMADGLVALDSEGTIVLANKRAEHLLGCTLTPGRRLSEIVRNDEVTVLVKKALSGSDTESTHISTPSGYELELCTSSIPQPQHRGVLVIIRDVTEMRRLDNMRKEFVANASHELRTPVSLIRGYVETLNAGAAEDPVKRKQFLSVLEKNVNQLSNLIEDLLKLSSLDAGKMVRKEEKVDIRQLAFEVTEQFKELARKKELSLTFKSVEPHLMVIGDSALIRQAITNLVDNAVKYTNSGGSVTVEVRSENRQIFVEVTDTGIGIEKEHLPRIFERFYRVDKSRSRDLGGTGLGLSIVKHVVSAYGGEVSVQSEPGKGSKFTVALPQA